MPKIKTLKGYGSVVEMLKGEFPEDADLRQGVAAEVQKRRMSFFLTLLRFNRSLSQRDVAKRMGVDEEAVRAMESGGDGLGFNQTLEYIKVLEPEPSSGAVDTGDKKKAELVREYLIDAARLLEE